MAISETINSIKEHLGEAYASLEEKQATIPTNKNIENLADSILSIPSGGGEQIQISGNYFYDLYNYNAVGNTANTVLETDIIALVGHDVFAVVMARDTITIENEENWELMNTMVATGGGTTQTTYIYHQIANDKNIHFKVTQNSSQRITLILFSLNNPRHLTFTTDKYSYNKENATLLLPSANYNTFIICSTISANNTLSDDTFAINIFANKMRSLTDESRLTIFQTYEDSDNLILNFDSPSASYDEEYIYLYTNTKFNVTFDEYVEIMKNKRKVIDMPINNNLTTFGQTYYVYNPLKYSKTPIPKNFVFPYQLILSSSEMKSLFSKTYYTEITITPEMLPQQNFIKSTYGTFSGNEYVKKIDIRYLTFPLSTGMSYFFQNDYLCEEIDIDSLDFTDKTANFGAGMFVNCGSRLSSGNKTKVYVKDEIAQQYVLSTSSVPSSWNTDNVIIAGSEKDLRDM